MMNGIEVAFTHFNVLTIGYTALTAATFISFLGIRKEILTSTSTPSTGKIVLERGLAGMY